MQQPRPLKLLLIGETCDDKYILGTCTRLSPEAPVPIVKINDTTVIRGMASNVYDNIQSIGTGIHQIDFITNTEKITKTRIIDERSMQQMLRIDEEPKINPLPLSSKLNLNSYDAIIISDYDKGFLNLLGLVYIRQNYDGPIYLDTKKRHLKILEDFYVKINDNEYSNLITTPQYSELVITQGSKGTLYNERLFPAVPVKEVADVCGCGDTFLAAFALAHLETDDIEYAISFANVAASITVQHHGNYAPSIEEILAR